MKSRRRHSRAVKSRSSETNTARNNTLLPALLPPNSQIKIRKKAVVRCQKQWQARERLHQEIEQHNLQDVPEYNKWYQSSFASLLQQRTEMLDKYRNLTDILRSVELESEYSGISMRKAYKKVTKPGYVFEGQKEFEQFTYGQGMADEFECDCDFCRAARMAKSGIFGDSDDSSNFFEESEFSSRAMAEEMFNAFAEEIFEAEFGGDFNGNRQRRRAFEKFKKQLAKESGFESFAGQFEEDNIKYSKEVRKESDANDEISEERRCQTIYRLLAKQLHPDVVKQTRLHQELWQMASVAYQQRNLGELDKVYVLAAMLKQSDLEGQRVSDIHGAADQLKHQNNQMRKEIRVLKRSRSWSFSVQPVEVRSKLFNDEKRELDQNLNYLSTRIEDLSAYLNYLEPKKKGSEASKSNRQAEMFAG